ncbi:MAG: energy transducer TonB [Aureispira sp.]|nr:energy transducer TonB [Aureispira sp.]
MKKIISFLLVLCFHTVSFSQDFNIGIYPSSSMNNQFRQLALTCWVQRADVRPVKKEILDQAEYISDFYPNYPSSWLEHYISTEITATVKDEVITIAGLDNKLTPAQQDLLKKVDLNSNLVIDVKYKKKNVITNTLDERKMHTSIAVSPYTTADYPKVEAKFLEGDLNKFLDDKIKNKAPKVNSPTGQQAVILFTINDEGQAVNVKMIESFGDLEVDKLLLKTVRNMPKWSPAKNAKGINVKQHFKFFVGYGRC